MGLSSQRRVTESSGLALRLGRYGTPHHTRAALLWRSRNMRIIPPVLAWNRIPEESRRSLHGIRTVSLGAMRKPSPGMQPSGTAFTRCLHEMMQKDYALGYLFLILLSKSTTAIWVALEVLSRQQNSRITSNGASPSRPSKDPTSRLFLAKAIEGLFVPRSLIQQVGGGVVVPRTDELADILHLAHPHDGPASVAQPISAKAGHISPAADSMEGGSARRNFLSLGPSDKFGEFGGDIAAGGDRAGSGSEVLPSSFPYPKPNGWNPGSPEPSSAGGGDDCFGNGGSIGSGGRGGGDNVSSGGGGGDDGDPPPQGSSFQSQLWMAIALAFAVIIPPNALAALLLMLCRPLVHIEQNPRPRLARRVTPRKRRFVLLQHATAQAMDGESFLLLSPRSVAAALLFPPTGAGDAPDDAATYAVAASSPGCDDMFQPGILSTAVDLPSMGDLHALPLSAQLTTLAEELMSAYEREARLAARLITRRAVSYALSNDQISRLNAALDDSSAALVSSKLRVDAISCSLEALQQDLERDVSMLCAQLEGVSGHRDALLNELAVRHTEAIEVMPEPGGDLAALIMEAEAERRELQIQLSEVRKRLDESDACARLAVQERDQARRRTDDLTAQLKHAARFAAALEDTMSALPDLPSLAAADDTELLPDVGTWGTITATTDPAFPPPVGVTSNEHRNIAASADAGDNVNGSSGDVDEKEIDYAMVSSAGQQVMYTPLRTVISTAQQRAMELRHLKEENAALHLQVSTQTAAHAADADALATAQREAMELLADVAQLEEQLIGAVAARRRLEEDLAMAQTMLGELHDRLRASAEQLVAAKRAQADAESQLTASKVENAELGVQLQASDRELAAVRAHLLHAQHHVAEVLAEKTMLRQQLQAAKAEAGAQDERCRIAETAAASLTECLANVQAQLTALTTKLRNAQADAGSALASKACLEAYVAELAYMQEQADAAALAATEELREEIKELQYRLDDAQAGRRLAERQAEELRDQVQGLETRLAAVEGAAASADAVEAQRAAELRPQLAAATAALQEAQAAVAAAQETEASQAAAMRAAAATISGLQATIGQLQRSLAAAEHELQLDRAEAAAAAAASAAREAKMLHDLHKRDAIAAGLDSSLTEVRAQLSLVHEDANAKVMLANELAVCLRELQSKLISVEAVNKEAASLREARVCELAQQCEAACRAVADLQAQLYASEAERGKLQAQVATAESEQLRLVTEVACAEDEQGKLEAALHAAGESRKSWDAHVIAGDASTSDLQARLYRAEEVLSEILLQRADANTFVGLLHLRAAVGTAASTDTERTRLSPSGNVSAEPVAAEVEHQELDGMRSLLEARLQQLPSCVDALESASDAEHSLRAVQVAELQRQCELGSRSVVALREHLAASENARLELIARAAEAQTEREGLLTEVAEALTEQARLREALEAAAAERRCLEEDLVANEAKRAELEAYLCTTQAAHSEVMAQLAFSNSALQLLQQHLQNSDAERLDLQVQLGAFVDERRELRVQLLARLEELQSGMEMAEAASADASAVLVARVDVLQSRCEADGELLQHLRDQLLASEEARRELLERALVVERRLQAAEAQVAEVESAQQALVSQAAETVVASQQTLHAALSCAEVETCDLRAQVTHGEALRLGLQQRLESSEGARIEVMAQLAAASAELGALQQRVDDTLLERQVLRAGLEASAEARRELQIRLSELLLELQGRMEDVRSSIEDVDALKASTEVELAAQVKERAHCTEQLQVQLREGEAARQELMRQLAASEVQHADVLARLVAATTERQQLEERAAATEVAVHELSSQLAAARAEGEEVQNRLAASEAAQEELRARLDNMEVVHTEAQAQLADAGLALRALQQNLDDADAERRELQTQLASLEAKARGVQSQLSEKLVELQSAIRGVIDVTGTAGALQEAQRMVLEQGCEEGSRAAREWASDRAASQAALQLLAERVAAAEARQAALEAELGAADMTRAALETQIADAEVFRSNLQVQLCEVKAERSEAFLRLGDATNSLEVLQRHRAASDRERDQLQKICAAATETCEGLQAKLVAAASVHERDLQRLSEVQAERGELIRRVAAADATLEEMRERLNGAEAAYATEVDALRSAAAVAAADAAAQSAAAAAKASAAGEAMEKLKDRLTAAEASREELQARLAAADASRGELQLQLSASAVALTALQQQLERWETACDTTQQQLACTDAIARDLMFQLEDSETRRTELQQQLTAAAAERQQLVTELADAGRAAVELMERLTTTEGAAAQLRNQLIDCQRERDDLALQLADADAARRNLATQVYKFRTQMAVATDSAVIRRMTNATAIQEQYERLREEVARERDAGQARQERMLTEIANLQAAADQSAVRATVRVALARACLRAAEDERRRLQKDMQSLLLFGVRDRVARGWQQQLLGQIPADSESDVPPSPNPIGYIYDNDDENCPDPITPTRRSSEARMDATTAPAVALVAAAAVSRRRQRTSIRVASLGGFLQQGLDVERAEGGVVNTNADAQSTMFSGNGFLSNRRSVTDYQQQLEHVRQRLIELGPQTTRSLAAVDAALDVPSSFVDIVQSAVNSASPLAEGWAQAGRERQLRDSMHDSFSMVPDLSSLGTMLDANIGHGHGSNAGAAGVAPLAGVPSRHEGAPQVLRFPPVVPFSTPVTEYRQSSMTHVSRNVTPSSTQRSPLEGGLLPPSMTIGEQLAALQDELNKMEETGRRLGARLEAASQSPPTSILETVTAQLSQRHQEAFLRQSAERHQGDARMEPALPVAIPIGDTSTRTGTGTEGEPPDLLSPDPLMQLDLDVATTPPDAQSVAASLAALRSGIQSFIAQHQTSMALRSPSPHGQSLSPSAHQPGSGFHSAAAAVASLSTLLAHVQVLEDYLLGNSVISGLPTPIDMLLPLPRSPAPAAARYAAPVGAATGGARAVAGCSGTAASTTAGSCGVGRYTDGTSTPLEAPSPKTEMSSEAVTTPSDSPLLMATDSPAPQRLSASAGIKHHNFHYRPHNHHMQPGLDKLDQDLRAYPRPHQYQHQHVHHTQKATRRQDLIAADGIVARPFRSSAAHPAISTAAAANADAGAPAGAKPSSGVPSSAGGMGRRVASIHALTYEDSSLSFFSPSLTSLTRAQGLALPPLPGKEGFPSLIAATGIPPGSVAASGTSRMCRPTNATPRGSCPDGDVGVLSVSSVSTQSHRRGEQYDDGSGQLGRSSESPLAPSLDEEAIVLTATPVPRSPTLASEPSEPTFLPPPPQQYRHHIQQHQQFCLVSLSDAAAALAAAVATSEATARSRRGGFCGRIGGAGVGSAAFANGSRMSSPSTPVSDDVCVATPLAFAVTPGVMAGAAPAATPCITPAPLDASAAEQLLRYTNPCFMRTPSASEICAIGPGLHSQNMQHPLHQQQNNEESHIRHDYIDVRPTSLSSAEQQAEPPLLGPGLVQVPAGADGLPALEISDSVDVTDLRAARRRMAGGGLGAVSIEEAPVASVVRVPRSTGRSMPVLATPPPTVSSDEEETCTLMDGVHEQLMKGRRSVAASAGPPLPAPDFAAAAIAPTRDARSISLQGSAAENAVYDSYKADRHATGLLCLPTRSRRFSFRLSSRQSSRSSVVQPSNEIHSQSHIQSQSQGRSHVSAAADDAANVASSGYQQYVHLYSHPYAHSHPQATGSMCDTHRSSLEHSARGTSAGVPPRPPNVGGKEKAAGLLGKIKRAVGNVVGRSSSMRHKSEGSTAGASSSAGTQRGRSTIVTNSISALLTPRPL